jgi:hypothetical protein
LNAPIQFLEYWYFHIPNYLLAVIMYSLLGRFLLSVVFAPNSDNYIFRAFVLLTDPAIRVSRFVTPRAVPELLLILFTVIWTMMLRFALLAWFASLGLAPTVGG